MTRSNATRGKGGDSRNVERASVECPSISAGWKGSLESQDKQEVHDRTINGERVQVDVALCNPTAMSIAKKQKKKAIRGSGKSLTPPERYSGVYMIAADQFYRLWGYPGYNSHSER